MGFDIASASRIALLLLFALLVKRLVSVPLLPVEILNKGFNIGNFIVPCNLGQITFDLAAEDCFYRCNGPEAAAGAGPGMP